MPRERLGPVNRIVIKVGTSTITHGDEGLDFLQLERLVRQIADVANRGLAPLLVTSGAVGAGMSRLNLSSRPSTIKMTQAVAAVGQGLLMEIYTKLFGEYGYTCAQVLLTRSDLENRQRYLNARSTLLTLLQLKVIPVINENDTVTVDEIKFGDNDTLSALVSGLVDADLLIILSDVDGLYTDDPREHAHAQLLHEVEQITAADLEKAANAQESTMGTGGMLTKLEAAQIATSCGIPVIVADGREDGVIYRLLENEVLGTLFHPNSQGLTGRKRWLAYNSRPHGTIVVYLETADRLVNQGESLLSQGIKYATGEFGVGDLVRIEDEQGREIARGQTNYPADQVKRIMGQEPEYVARVLRYKYDDAVIHRDNLVILDHALG